MIHLRDDAAFRDGVMRCVRCSICVPKCPSYAVFRNESDSPRGRVQLLRAAMEGRVVPDGRFEGHLDKCLGCRACEDVCPSGVPYGALLDQARKELAPSPHAKGRKRMTRFFLQEILVEPGTLAVLSRLLAFVQWLRLDRLARWLLRPLSAKLARRIDLLPRVAGAPFNADDVAVPEQPTAAFHAGCLMASALGDVQRAALRVLEQNGHATLVPTGQRCCGALHQHSGMLDEARGLARETIAAFEGTTVPICTTSAGCALAMKEYGALLADEPEWAERAAAFSARIRDLSQLGGSGGRVPAGKVAVQEACHHWNVQQLRGVAVDVLRSAGADVVSLPRGAGCCGAAGLWSAQHPEAAWELLQPLLDSIEGSGCDVVAISNPGCLFHIRAGLRSRSSKVRALHLAEVLDTSLATEDRDQ
ncbi:MAG: 4Fe-4S dicluster domain-containing protein [Deltaproteobacteria bacterium]|nr:4Fe-4S dicluster domain-containing protein [Deltaproteobacteria bacterium]